MFRCVKFLVVDRTLKKVMVNLTSINLEDEALEWHQVYIKMHWDNAPVK